MKIRDIEKMSDAQLLTEMRDYEIDIYNSREGRAYPEFNLKQAEKEYAKLYKVYKKRDIQNEDMIEYTDSRGPSYIPGKI
jgi:hypothetical protein